VIRVLIVAAIFLYSSTTFSAVPQIINYQGTLSDSGGNPINATLNITFTLYDADVAGNNLWQETQSVDVTNGVFNVQFGADAGNPLSPAIFDDPLFLGIQVDADAEMTPRQALTAAGYAFKARSVENDTLNSLSCANGEVPKWNGGAWACAADENSGGDITGVTAGTGLTGGGASGNVNIVADTNVLQSRVTGICPTGQSIRVINPNGTVACEVDSNSGGDITGVTAGFGLLGGGSSGSVTISSNLSQMQRRVSGSCGVGSSIRVITQNGTVTCEPDTDTVRPPASLSHEPLSTLSNFGGGVGINTLDIGGMTNRFCMLSQVMVEDTDTANESAGCDVIINANGRWLLRAKLQDPSKDANVTCSAKCFLLQN